MMDGARSAWHTGACRPNGDDDPAGYGCNPDCPRLLRARIRKLEDGIRAHLDTAGGEWAWSDHDHSLARSLLYTYARPCLAALDREKSGLFQERSDEE